MKNTWINKNTTIILIIVFFLWNALFFVFSYNSGFGYDALDYLVIGRSLLDGYDFYSFYPAKSFGMYYFAAFILYFNKNAGHIYITSIITLLYTTTLILTFLIVKNILNKKVALVSTFLVSICCYSMELNFLIPEYFINILGFVSVHQAIVGLQKRNSKHFFLSGIFIGIGTWFKATAALSFLGILSFLIIYLITKKEPIIRSIHIIFKLIIGFLICLLIPMIYFYLTNRLTQHLEWTYFYPLFNYSLESYTYKLYTKVVWFPVLFVLALVLSFNGKIKNEIYNSYPLILILVVGLFTCLQLLKSQSGHYLFSGATLISIFIAAVWDKRVAAYSCKKYVSNNCFYLLSTLLLVMMSVFLYNPKVLARFTHLEDYSKGEELKNYIRKYVTKDKSALFFKNNMFLYWISGRYPNYPFIHTHVQWGYVINKNPRLLYESILDPNLSLIEFNPEILFKGASTLYLGIDDRDFMKKRKNLMIINKFYQLLTKHYVRSNEEIKPYIFWTRKIQSN